MNEGMQQAMKIATAEVVPAETPGNLAIADFESIPVEKILRNVSTIQALMGKVLKDKVHYGTIDGCGDKKSLLKPGAEKLCMTFRLIPKYYSTTRYLADGHIDVETITHLYDPLGRLMGYGIGSCSTMESKYRWRKGDPVSTGKPLQRAYWDLRKSKKQEDWKAAQKLIGGRGFTHMKDEDGKWVIGKFPDTRVENPDIADTWNTVRKQSKKRSIVDATITALACSDMFEQGEDGDDDDDQQSEGASSEPEKQAPAGKQAPEPETGVRHTYDLSAADPKTQQNLKILLSKQKAKEVAPNIWESSNRIASIDKYHLSSRAASMCGICGLNPVDSNNGEDTCATCLEKM